MSLFLTIKKLGFQIDPLPPLNPMPLHILFFVWMASIKQFLVKFSRVKIPSQTGIL